MMSEEGDEHDPSGDPIVSCELQGGTLSVYEDHVFIDRSSASMYADKSIPLEEVVDVNYSGGIMSGHIQLVQTGVEADESGFLSKPVDENTLYFPRTGRQCASRARDAILERCGTPR